MEFLVQRNPVKSNFKYSANRETQMIGLAAYTVRVRVGLFTHNFVFPPRFIALPLYAAGGSYVRANLVEPRPESRPNTNANSFHLHMSR